MNGILRIRAGRFIDKAIPAEGASLNEWNDALFYLTGEGPEKTAQTAREKLIRLMNGRES